MSTARDFHLSAAPSAFPSPATLWARLLAVMKAVIKMAGKKPPVLAAMSAGTPPDCQTMSLPVAGKIAAISVAGELAFPGRKVLPLAVLAVPAKGAGARNKRAGNLRRPGVQSRWKASDRVAML